MFEQGGNAAAQRLSLNIGPFIIGLAGIFSFNADKAAVAGFNPAPNTATSMIGAPGSENVECAVATKAKLGEWAVQIGPSTDQQVKRRHVALRCAGGVMDHNPAHTPHVAAPARPPVRRFGYLESCSLQNFGHPSERKNHVASSPYC